jgi:predicted nuclease of predicted toxin-antitoxin system
MRLIANENVSGTVIRTLRERGHDVLSVKESMRAANDETVLARAQSEQRLVLTNDKDFGELAFRYGLPASCGVVLFRLSGVDPESDNRHVLQVLESRTDWEGYFAVVDHDRIRMRPLPATPVKSDAEKKDPIV